MNVSNIKREDKLIKKKQPKQIAKKKLYEDEYEYLKSDNGNYKDNPDSSNGGVATVQKVKGTMGKTKSPIGVTSVRNNWWMDRGVGREGGVLPGYGVLPNQGMLNCSMITTKKNLKEAVKVLKALNERDVIKLPSSNEAPIPPMEEDPNAMPPDPGMEMGDAGMGDPNAMPTDPGMGGAGGTNDPNIDKLIELLSANPDRAEGVYKYAKGIIGDDTVPDENADPADPGMEPPMDDPGMETPPPPQTESKINLDELINDYMKTDKPTKPTIVPNTGSGVSKTLKSKMFRPIVK